LFKQLDITLHLSSYIEQLNNIVMFLTKKALITLCPCVKCHVKQFWLDAVCDTTYELCGWHEMQVCHPNACLYHWRVLLKCVIIIIIVLSLFSRRKVDSFFLFIGRSWVAEKHCLDVNVVSLIFFVSLITTVFYCLAFNVSADTFRLPPWHLNRVMLWRVYCGELTLPVWQSWLCNELTGSLDCLHLCV